jgi:hypothetical protein
MGKEMHRLFMITVLVIPFSLHETDAQGVNLGGGAGIGDGYTYHGVNTGIPGFFLRGSYLFTDFLEASFSTTLFLPNKEYLAVDDGERRSLVWMLDFDVHYIFSTYGMQWSFYALAGLDVNFLSSKYLGKETFPNDYSDNYPGVNAGIGSGYQVGSRSKLFAEMKYTLGKFHQWSLSVGFLFNIEGMIKKK